MRCDIVLLESGIVVPIKSECSLAHLQKSRKQLSMLCGILAQHYFAHNLTIYMESESVKYYKIVSLKPCKIRWV